MYVFSCFLVLLFACLDYCDDQIDTWCEGGRAPKIEQLALRQRLRCIRHRQRSCKEHDHLRRLDATNVTHGDAAYVFEYVQTYDAARGIKW